MRQATAATLGTTSNGMGRPQGTPGGPRTGSKPMDRGPVGASRWLRLGLFCLATTVTALAVTSDPADARHRRKRHYSRHIVHSEVVRPRAEAASSQRRAQPESGGSRYADIVMDAKTGSVLHQSSPDGLRHPASLTKIMTLYLLFEKLEAGKVKLWN